MKKSFLWAFSLAICLIACLTACDNDSVVDESTTDSSVSTQIPSSTSGTVDLFDSVGNKVSTAPFEILYQIKDSTSHTTRSSMGGMLDEIYFDVAPQNVIYTQISTSGLRTVYKGYIIATAWGTVYLGNPEYGEDYYHQEMIYPDKKGYKFRFECIVQPFSMEYTFWARGNKMATIYIHTDFRIFVNTRNSQLLSQNLAWGTMPKALQQLRPEYLWHIFEEMTNYETGKKYHYKGYIYY